MRWARGARLVAGALLCVYAALGAYAWLPGPALLRALIADPRFSAAIRRR